MNYTEMTGVAVAREFTDGQDGDYSEYSFCCGAKYLPLKSEDLMLYNGEKVAKTEEIYKSALCSECKSSEHTGR
jgi:hypothetical protein